jgi:hypothetical protein
MGEPFDVANDASDEAVEAARRLLEVRLGALEERGRSMLAR